MNQQELERLASFPELNPSPIFELDRTGGLTYQNPASRVILPDLGELGHPASVGLTDMIDLDDGPSVHIREVTIGDRVYEQQITVIPPECIIRVYMTDITPRKDTEVELKGYQDRLEAMVEEATAESSQLASVVRQSTESIVITDLSGTIQYVNPAFERITGYRADEAIGNNPRILRADRAYSPPNFYQQLWQTILGGNVWSGEFTNRKKNGETYIEEAVIFPIKDEKSGEIRRFGAVKNDVTRRRELENQLRDSFAEMVRLKENAENANRSKSEFLAHMSHEIRTPLNGIIGFLELLGQSDLEAQQGEFVSTIRQSAHNLMGIINDILDLSKIESGKLELENVAFDPSREFESIVDLFSSSANEKGIEFYSFIDPLLPGNLIGDPLRLKQVLTNFISNSLKFTERAKTVSVNIRLLDRHDDRCRIRFAVQDQGIGIPLDKQQMIMEAFSQADTSVSRRFGGTGLGLAISNRLIGQMGGTLQVDSEEGRGSEFYFELEMKIGAKAAQRPAQVHARIGVAGDPKLEPEALIGKYLDALRCEVRWLSGEDISGLQGLDAVLIVFRPGNTALLAAYTESAVPIILVVDERDRTRIELPDAAGGVRVVYAPVYGSKLYDAVAEIKYGVRGESLEDHVVQETVTTEMRGTALVAEDNAVNQKLITYMLREVGLTAEVAPDGKRAVELFEQGHYQIVFMDASMPVLDGIAATGRILEIERSQGREHTPIVALTAHAIKGDREKFLDAGMDDYLPKPIDLDTLHQVLDRQLGH